MITIGDFIKTGREFHGVIETLSLLREVWLIPCDPAQAGEPDYSLHLAQRPARIGMGWKNHASAGDIEILINDPGLAAPMHCRLVQNVYRYDLIWDERRPWLDTGCQSLMLSALQDAQSEIEQMLEDYADEPDEDMSAHRTLITLKAAIASGQA